MRTRPTTGLFALTTLSLLITPLVGMSRNKPSAGPADESDISKASDLGFLKVGRAYYIKFPDDRHPVQVRESGDTPAPTGTSNGSSKYQVNVFVVKRLGGGSWALLEHPENPKEAIAFMVARYQLADDKRVAALGATEEGRNRLEGLRERAGRELKTTETWINLTNAISISAPPQSIENWTIDNRVESDSSK